MKPTSHDPLDDLIAAALHGDLTPAERAQFETRLANDPAALAAYQEALLMHDLLEKTHTSAQPDPNFEQRMVSGVRRKLADDQRPRESAWQSLVILWTALGRFLRARRIVEFIVVIGILAILAGVAFGPITAGIKKSKQSEALQRAYVAQLEAAQQAVVEKNVDNNAVASSMPAPETAEAAASPAAPSQNAPSLQSGQIVTGNMNGLNSSSDAPSLAPASLPTAPASSAVFGIQTPRNSPDATASVDSLRLKQLNRAMGGGMAAQDQVQAQLASKMPTSALAGNLTDRQGYLPSNIAALTSHQAPAQLLPQPTTAAADLSRKLIRNADLELEVKSFQAAMDQIAALAKAAGGYVDTDNSQKGGNGKLQGIVIVKVLPQNLDDFLLKLRDLGEIKNQNLGTEDVTREYVDIQARLDNAHRMEEQLQELLKRDTGRVADLLMVERELGRVRGEIEQMQGQLKLYDFEVQYSNVTMQVREKDLNQAAAYLLKEQDNFSLLATDVEATFQQARQTADDFKAQVLAANLNHNSGSDVSAVLVVMVPPDQIEPFLAQIRTLGRVANFTRQTRRVARDGGDSDQPADATLTEKDKVEVQITIGSDDESRKQVALTVVTSTVDDALDKAKSAALVAAGTEILSSSLNKTPEGQSTASLSVRVPGKNYHALLDSFRALGRTSSFSLQRDDDSGPGANGDDAPVILNLSLTDDETPLQQTQLAVLATDVDNQEQQLKQTAANAGVEIKASSFQRQPDGVETAQMTFRLPMAKYTAFVEVLKKLGKVESLTVSRNDRPDQTHTDETAPAEIDFTLHNQGDIVADDNGLWATLRQMFSEGAAALFDSVRVIGVFIAFLIPWLLTLVLLAWLGRRIYIWRKR